MRHRQSLQQALETVSVARREIQADFDQATITLLNAAPGTSEEEAQKLGGLVRQLDGAVRELCDAIRTCDQLIRLRERETLNGVPGA